MKMKKKILPLLLTVGMLAIAALATSPFQVDTAHVYDMAPEVKNFKYWFGDPRYGSVYYLGTEDVAGFETELHINFDSKRRVASATLILGPAGLDINNCFKRYKEVSKLISEKYGGYSFIKEIKDPIIEDLIFSEACVPVRYGYEIKTYWMKKGLKITSTLIGDEEGYYVEVEYLFNDRAVGKEKLKKLL